MQSVSSLSASTNYQQIYANPKPSDPNRSLIKALRQENLKRVMFFIETEGASLVAQDAHGNQPLHVAVIMGSLPCVSYLLDRSADPKAPNRDGKTALQLAQEANNQTLVLMLSREAAPPVDANAAVAHKKDEVALRNAMLQSTAEEDLFSTHLLKLKGAAKERGGELGTKLRGLIKQLHHPWIVLQEQPKGGFFDRWVGPTAHPFDRRDFNAQSPFFKPLSDKIVRVSNFQRELQPFLSRKNNQTISDSLTAIARLYETFRSQLCQTSPQIRRQLMEGRVQVRGADLGCHFLNGDAVQKLFHSEKANQYGMHRVACLHGVYWKENPYAPGIEKAVDSLNKLVSGQGSPATALTKITYRGQGLPFMASKSVSGDTLQDVLWDKSAEVMKIHPGNFSAMVVLGILSDPVDGKPDNFILASGPTPDTLVLVSIDNDMAFSSGVYQYYSRMDQRSEHMIDVMYTPFCFPQMKQAVDPAFGKAFLALCPEDIVLKWLRGINDQNGAYKELREQKVFSAEEYEKLQLPIALSPSAADEPGLVELLYQKLKAMQKLLSERYEKGENVTHWDLFYAAHPIVARYYRSRIDDYHQKESNPTVLGTFMHLFKEGQPRPCVEDAVQMRSVVKSKLTVKSALAKHQQKGGQHELSRTQSPKRAIEAFIADLPWKTLQPEVQERLLNELFIIPYLRRLVLKEVSGLSDRHLMRLADHVMKLEELTLTGCPQVTEAGLSALLTKRPHLKITVCGCRGLKAAGYRFLFQNSQKFSVELASGEEVNAASLRNPQALHQTIYAGEEAVFFGLLGAGALLNGKEEQSGYTPLHCAVGRAEKDLQQSIRMILALLLTGASSKEVDNSGETALARAKRKGLKEIATLMEGVQDSSSAVLRGDSTKVVVTLLDDLPKIPLLKKLVLEDGRELTDQQLMKFVEQTEKLEELELRTCSQITENGLKATLAKRPQLKLTVCQCEKLNRKSHVSLVQVSEKFSGHLATGETIDREKVQSGLALHQAIIAMDEEVFFFLLGMGIRINQRNEHGDTPMHCLVSLCEKNREMGERLITALAYARGSLTIKDRSGETAEQRAKKKGIGEVAKMLEQLKDPVISLLWGDQQKDQWPNERGFLKARRAIYEEAYRQKGPWVKSFEHLSYRDESRFQWAIPGQENKKNPLGFLEKHCVQMKRLILSGVEKLKKDEIVRLCTKWGVEEILVDTEQWEGWTGQKIGDVDALGKIVSAGGSIGGIRLRLQAIKWRKGTLVPNDIKKLMGFLSQTTISQLDLRTNSIVAEGCKELARVLPQTTISQLDLSYNSIGDSGCKELARGLPQTTISQLDLSYNSIGDSGCKELARGLPQTSISQLNLTSNSIGAEGCKELARVLPQTTISQLNLWDNSIGAEEEGVLKALEKQMPGITISY